MSARGRDAGRAQPKVTLEGFCEVLRAFLRSPPNSRTGTRILYPAWRARPCAGGVARRSGGPLNRRPQGHTTLRSPFPRDTGSLCAHDSGASCRTQASKPCSALLQAPRGSKRRRNMARFGAHTAARGHGGHESITAARLRLVLVSDQSHSRHQLDGALLRQASRAPHTAHNRPEQLMLAGRTQPAAPEAASTRWRRPAAATLS